MQHKEEARKEQAGKAYQEWFDEDKREKVAANKVTQHRHKRTTIYEKVMSRLSLAGDGTLLCKAQPSRVSPEEQEKQAEECFSAYVQTRDEEDARAKEARKKEKKKAALQREDDLKRRWSKKMVVCAYSTSRKAVAVVPATAPARSPVVARGCWLAEGGPEGEPVALDSWFELREGGRISSTPGLLMGGRWKLLRAEETGRVEQKHVRSGQQVLIAFEACEGNDGNAGCVKTEQSTSQSPWNMMLLCCAGHRLWRVQATDGTSPHITHAFH